MTHGFILLFHIIFYISSFTQHIQINIFKTTLRFSTYFCCSKLRQAYFTGFLQTGHWNKCVSCGFRESLRQINGLLLVGLTWAERDVTTGKHSLDEVRGQTDGLVTLNQIMQRNVWVDFLWTQTTDSASRQYYYYFSIILSSMKITMFRHLNAPDALKTNF